MSFCAFCSYEPLNPGAVCRLCQRCWDLDIRCTRYQFELWASTEKGQSRLQEIIKDATEALRARGVSL